MQFAWGNDWKNTALPGLKMLSHGNILTNGKCYRTHWKHPALPEKIFTCSKILNRLLIYTPWILFILTSLHQVACLKQKESVIMQKSTASRWLCTRLAHPFHLWPACIAQQ